MAAKYADPAAASSSSADKWNSLDIATKLIHGSTSVKVRGKGRKDGRGQGQRGGRGVEKEMGGAEKDRWLALLGCGAGFWQRVL